MRKFVLFLGLSFSPILISGSFDIHAKATDDNSSRKVVFIEFGGPGLVYSLNTSFMLSKKVAATIGFSYMGSDNDTFIALPIRGADIHLPISRFIIW